MRPVEGWDAGDGNGSAGLRKSLRKVSEGQTTHGFRVHGSGTELMCWMGGGVGLKSSCL